MLQIVAYKLKLHSDTSSYKDTIVKLFCMSVRYGLILVGGSAVEYYTKGTRIRSNDDIDFVSSYDAANDIQMAMSDLGFHEEGTRGHLIGDGFALLSFVKNELEVQVFLNSDTYFKEISAAAKSSIFSIKGEEVKSNVAHLLDLLFMKTSAAYDYKFTLGVSDHKNKHRKDLIHLFKILYAITRSKDDSIDIYLKHQLTMMDLDQNFEKMKEYVINEVLEN